MPSTRRESVTASESATDGASGVGVLLEMARMLQQNPVEYGVDFICFDAEDLGDDRNPEGGAKTAETWCLGSQYCHKTCINQAIWPILAFCMIWWAPAELSSQEKVSL